MPILFQGKVNRVENKIFTLSFVCAKNYYPVKF